MLFQKQFFTDEQRKAIVQAIGDAEATTSGEIRLHVEPKCKNENVLDRATEVFFQLKMNETADKNGALIYIAYDDHKFAIIGDEGINAVVPANFWDGIKEVMAGHFKKGEFIEGILFAVKETGAHLKQYFPLKDNDKNELSNEISEG
ncbi:MAG TPA: TPM domain-containing protein [Chitinophagales bacterium]|nr:TPM domain-containing protein [Chitinophagales bacterium]